ncbi:MAG: hypothetical protein COB96_01475, partial [Planctomycetota bacterium]
MSAHTKNHSQISWSGLSSPRSCAPQDHVSPDERITYELLLSTSLRFFVLGPPFIAMWLFFGQPWPAIIILAGELLNWMCWQGARRARRAANWGWLLLAGLAMVLATTSALSGGLSSPGLLWMPVLPLIGAFLYGARGAIISGTVAVVVGVLFLVMELGGITALNLVPSQYRAIFTAANMTGAVASVLWLAHAWQQGLHRANRSPQVSENGFREALEHLPEAFLLLVDSPSHAEGFRVVYSNPAARPILQPLQQRGLSLADCLPDEEYQRLREQLADAHSNGQVLVKRGIHHPLNGRVYDLTVTRWGKGAVLCLHDATTRAEVESHLRAAGQQAQQNSQATGDFLANMSHELRTPMNGIMGMAELALDTDMSEEQSDYLQTIRDCAENMGELIDSVLDLSKIEAGCMELEQRPFNLDELLERLLDGLASKAAERHLEWNALRHHDVPVNLIGDRMRLRQVLVNLAGNAIKFTEHGEVAVEVELEDINDEEVCLRFSVRDTGIGITAEQLPGLFDKFTQADPSTTRKYGGSGLGLTISQELVDAMGGKLEVSS